MSLSTKLIGVFILASTLLFLVLSLLLGVSFRQHISEQIEPYFSHHLLVLKAQIGMPPDLRMAKRLSNENHVVIEIDAPGYRWSSDGQFIDPSQLEVEIQSHSDDKVGFEAGFYQDDRFILRSFDHGYIFSFIVDKPVDRQINYKIILQTLFFILLIIGALYAVIVYLFRPVHAMEIGIKSIGSGNMGYRLNISRQDELGSLASSINKMADNIEQMLLAKRQLLLAISHELRTPLTRAKLALSLSSEHCQNQVAPELDEIELLIHELLESERLRESHTALEKFSVNINDLIYQLQGRFFAEEKSLHLSLNPHLPNITLDPKQISLALKNLVKNALTAGKDSQHEVSIRTRLQKSARGNALCILVIDSGIGVSQDDLKRLTEPFYRPDASRQRSTGGVGIGLYLVKAIIEAHGGQLRMQSRPQLGTCVTIVLPYSET